MTAFQELIKRYANGRQICNCGEAYYTNCGHGSVPNGLGDWDDRTDLPACQYGCSANRCVAKEGVAKFVLREYIIGSVEGPKQ